MEISERLKSLPPYIFVELDKKKEEAKKEGKDILSLGIGDPDKPTPGKIIKRAQEALEKPENHPYPIGSGSAEFREAIINWMKRRFNVSLEMPETLVLSGAKDGITHLPFAFVNKGDTVLIPDPAYPGYTSATLLAGGDVYNMPLVEENNFLPDLDAIPDEVYKKTKLMFLNYPNNPISAMAGKDFYEKAVKKAKEHDFIIAQDNAYCEIYFDENDKPVSILEAGGAKDVAVEFFSMSKSYNMTGWRSGFVVGNEKVLNGLAKIKGNVDSGTFTAIQEVSAWALENCEDEVEIIRNRYKKRAKAFAAGLKELGYEFLEPKATLYLWVKVPKGYTSMDFAAKVLAETGLMVTPGIGFGKMADKYFRIALTLEEDAIREALERLKKVKL